MSGEIKAGDLVMMVRGHSCMLKVMGGVPYVVAELVTPMGGGWYCPVCKKSSAGPNEPSAIDTKRHGAPLSWLKKIDPPADDTEVIREKELEHADH